MSSSAAAAAARLALLSGPEIVAHLYSTSRRADWDAASRVLGDRDRRLAEAEAKAAEAQTGLAELGAEVEVLKERFLEQKAKKEGRGPGPGSGAIAAAAPRVGRRAEEPGPEGAIIDLCRSDDDDDDDEELEEGEFRLRPAGVAGVSCKRKEEPAAFKGDQGRGAGVSCEPKESASNGGERTPAGVFCKPKEPVAASKGDEGRRAGVSQGKEPDASNDKERTPAGVSCKRKEPAASKGDEGRRAGVSCQEKETDASNVKERTPAGVSCKREEPAASKGDDGRRAGVSCQQKEPASKDDEERTPAATSCKRKAPASASSPDDDDDRIPLSQLFMKKQRTAQAEANSAGLLGVDRPVIPPVSRGIPEAVAERMIGRPDDPKVVAFVQGTGNGRSGKNGGFSRAMPSPPPTGAFVQGTGNGQSGKNGGLSRAMPSPPPTASTAGNSPRKNCSKPDGSEGRNRIGEKQGRPVAHPENDAPVQLRTPRVTDTVRRIVGSARVGAETPMEHTDSSSDETISVVLKSVEGQEKATDGVHKTKVSLETNGTGNKGQVLNTKTFQLEQSSLPSAVTRNWKSSSALFNSCIGNYELCMEAVCALHRQQKFTTQPIVRRITKYDAHRVAVLAEFLLDGNLQGPLKKTAEDLEKHDSTGLDFFERVVLLCSEQLFSIYRSKEDKYFC